MILKLVQEKEIHVYGLKDHESLTEVCDKIRDMFKKLPDHFVLTYKNPEHQQIHLNTNEEFDNLIESLKNEFKTVKLYINPMSGILYQPLQTKSEQVIDSREETYECTQKIDNVRQLQEWTEKFTDLSENQDLLKLSEAQHPQLQQKAQSLLSSQQENDKNQTNLLEFQNFSSPQQLQPYLPTLQEREHPSQREIHMNLEETSDPHDLTEITERTNTNEKEKLIQSNPSEEKKQDSNPPIAQQGTQLEDLEEKKEFKPSSQQKIIPSISQKMIKEVPVKVEQVEDDFRSHNAKCDICNVFPIYGVRYLCVLCPNYDLCERCEQKYSHQHPLLKICYTYQTPIKLDVEIPQFNPKSKNQHQVVLVKEDIRGLSEDQRRERILNYSSEISELLNIDIQDCLAFIRVNEDYNKETLIQLLINRKCGLSGKVPPQNQENHKQGLGGIFGNIKNFFTA